MIRRSLCLTALLAGLGYASDASPAGQQARNLERGLAAASQPDTARERADSQFATCLYVYSAARVDLDVLQKLADALGCKPGDLIDAGEA